MTAAFEPAMPPLPSDWLPLWKAVAAVRRNTISAWPRQAFESDIIVRKVAMRHQVIVNSPDYVRRVLLDNDANYGRSRLFLRIMQPVLGNGLLVSEGEDWRRQRRATATSYTPARGPALGRVVARHIGLLLQKWERLADGAVHNISSDVADFTLGVGAEAIFSEMEPKDLAVIFEAAYEYDVKVRPTIGDLLGLPKWASNPLLSVVPRTRATVDGMMLPLIRERMGKPDASDIFAAICAPGPDGRAPTAEYIRDQAVTLMFAGHMTTHAALLWSLYLLASHPGERRRVEEEADAVLSGRPPDHSDVANLPIARRAIEEAMRLYPPAYIIPRTALGPDRFGDVDVPKGATVIVSPWLLHRNPKLWDNPHRFIPDRFADADAARPRRFAYIPFADGPHVCIGAHFAMLELTMLVAGIVQRWRLDLPEGAVVEPMALATLRPRDGMPLVFHRRRPGE